MGRSSGQLWPKEQEGMEEEEEEVVVGVVLVSHGPPWLLLGEDIFTNGQIGKFEEKSFLTKKTHKYDIR